MQAIGILQNRIMKAINDLKTYLCKLPKFTNYIIIVY